MTTTSYGYHRRTRSGLTALVLCALLGACGSSAGSTTSAPPGEKPGVASLRTQGAAPAAAARSTERPLLRSDMSDADMRRLYKVYNGCLEDHGVDFAKMGNVKSKGGGLPPEAVKACASKEPEEVSARAERLDPDYADKARKWARCITDKGYPTHVNSKNELRQDDENALPTEKYSNIMNICQGQVFGQ
jgi:hypothetical protein